MNDFVNLRSKLKKWARDGWQTIDDATDLLEADSVIFWLDDGDTNTLESAYAPLSPKLLGFRQPLAAGLISQVFLSGMPLLEKDVKARSEHDPTMDEQTNFTCRSMIAVPVSPGDQIIGVLSAVRFEGERGRDAFSLHDLDRLMEVSRGVAADLEKEGGDDVA